MRQELAQKTPVRVMALEERVAIRIGACAWAIHFVDAFDLAAAIRTHAKAAKKEQGDESRTLLRAGVLSDAERNYKHGI